jgi:hypothetical protein
MDSSSVLISGISLIDFLPSAMMLMALKISGDDVANDRVQPRLDRTRHLIGVSGLEDLKQRFLADVIDICLIHDASPHKPGD